MKKVLTVISGVLIVVSINFFKTMDTTLLKKSDEIFSVVSKSGSNLYGTTLKAIKVASGKVFNSNTLKVSYFKFSYLKNGEKILVNIPDFSKHSLFKTILPPNLHIAPDKDQFMFGMESLKKAYISNSESVIKKLKTQNSDILRRDKDVFDKSKSEILQAEKNMLDATEKKDLVNQEKWLKELRRLTNKITFIQTPKGKPFKLYTEDEILTRQIQEISNPITNGRVFGYVWHHNENLGVIELVSKDIHEFNRHTGGNNIWGEGIR